MAVVRAAGSTCLVSQAGLEKEKTPAPEADPKPPLE